MLWKVVVTAKLWIFTNKYGDSKYKYMKHSNFITKDRNASKHIRKLSSPENDGCISLDGDVMGIPLKQWRWPPKLGILMQADCLFLSLNLCTVRALGRIEFGVFSQLGWSFPDASTLVVPCRFGYRHDSKYIIYIHVYSNVGFPPIKKDVCRLRLRFTRGGYGWQSPHLPGCWEPWSPGFSHGENALNIAGWCPQL